MSSDNLLYTVDDVVASCNACGAHTLSRDPKNIRHYLSCGGLAEVKKWEDYYNSPEWLEAVIEDVEAEVVCSECGRPGEGDNLLAFDKYDKPLCGECHAKHVTVVVHTIGKKGELEAVTEDDTLADIQTSGS